ncbi:hypothetical protein NHX12_002969, partial [Muraenolepis orangiensis]
KALVCERPLRASDRFGERPPGLVTLADAVLFCVFHRAQSGTLRRCAVWTVAIDKNKCPVVW